MSAALGAAPDMLTVDVAGGGIGRAAIVLTARHGVTVNFEAVPRTVEGVSYVREVRLDGMVHHRPIDRPLRFSYPGTAKPRDAAEAAVEEWNAIPGVESHYRVLEADGMLHFVPTEFLRADGVYEPYVPLLDTVISLDRTVGTPTDLWHHVIEKLSATAGVPILDVMDGFVMLGHANVPSTNPLYAYQSQLDVALPKSKGTARELFDAVLATQDVSNSWSVQRQLLLPGDDNYSCRSGPRRLAV